MADINKLIKSTTAYKIVCRDKAMGRLSHAYLLLTPDKTNVKSYLKIFAKLIACKDTEFCSNCRTCTLIENESLTDVKFYPAEDGGKISVDDVTEIVSDSFIKPYESDKKIYVLTDLVDVNTAGQNKLLKTLEEPSNGVFILMGATSEFAVLPTVKSRVKKLEIPLFSPEELFEALKDEFLDKEKLISACSNSDGTLGDAIKLYNDEKFMIAQDLATRLLTELNSSKDVLKVSLSISSSGVDIKEFLSVLESVFRDMAVYFSNGKLFNLSLVDVFKNTTGFNRASAIYALDKIVDAKKREFFNNNDTMLLENLLLSILEGKYKWKKS